MGGEYDVEVQAADPWGGVALPVMIEDILEVGGPTGPTALTALTALTGLTGLTGLAALARSTAPRPLQSAVIERWLIRSSGWLARIKGRTARINGWTGGSPRRPTLVLLIAIVAVLGIAIVVDGRHHASVAVNPPLPAPIAVDTPLDPQATALAAMVALANSAVPLRDYTISDDVHPSCPRGAADAPDPVTGIVTTVHRYLPQYTLLDHARGIDLAGTCAVEVRERSADGSVLVVIIVAPPNSDVTPFVTTKDNDRTDSTDVLIDSYGWRVEVGTTGQAGEQPTSDEVVGLAEDARLVW